MLPQRVDVMVVGLGPVGATVACLLGRQGVRALAVDAATGMNRAPRAIALDHDALRVLQQTGLPAGAFDTVAIPRVELRSPIFGTYACANTTGQVDGHPKLVTFFQPDLETALRAQLSRDPHVRIATGTEVVGIADLGPAVRAQLRGPDGEMSQVEAEFVVACDGAASFVRKAVGLEFRGETYEADWLVVDVRDAPRPIDHVEFVCDPSRPSPHMPAPRGRQRWEFKLRPGETRTQMERPDVVRELLRPWTGGADVTIERIAVYRFHARVADRFSVGRIFLAGDAAHLTPPFAGQGLVSGLRDALNLSWKVASVVRGRASPAILDSYDVERRPHARATVDLARLMGRLIMPSSLGASVLVHGLVRLLDAFPPTRPLFRELEIKPKTRFERGLFRRRTRGERLGPGAPFPQAIVRDRGGVVLSDEVLGTGMSLVGFGVDPAERLSPALRDAWTALGGRFVQIGHVGQALNLGPFARRCEDVSGAFLSKAQSIGWAAVVRPDRVVLAEGPAHDAAELVTTALGLLGAPAQSLTCETRPAMEMSERVMS